MTGLIDNNGALGRIRTPDPLVRSQVLYPTELPARRSCKNSRKNKEAYFADFKQASQGLHIDRENTQ